MSEKENPRMTQGFRINDGTFPKMGTLREDQALVMWKSNIGFCTIKSKMPIRHLNEDVQE